MKFQCLHCGYIGKYDLRGVLYRGKKRISSYCAKAGKDVFLVKVKGTAGNGNS